MTIIPMDEFRRRRDKRKNRGRPVPDPTDTLIDELLDFVTESENDNN